MIDKGRLTAVKSDFIDIFTLKKDEMETESYIFIQRFGFEI